MVSVSFLSPKIIGNAIFTHSASTYPLLGCMLTSWEKFDPESLEKKRLIFCNTVWLQYKAGNGEAWPVNGTIKFNTVL